MSEIDAAACATMRKYVERGERLSARDALLILGALEKAREERASDAALVEKYCGMLLRAIAERDSARALLRHVFTISNEEGECDDVALVDLRARIAAELEV